MGVELLHFRVTEEALTESVLFERVGCAALQAEGPVSAEPLHSPETSMA